MTEAGRPADAGSSQTAFGRALRLAWWSYVYRLDVEMAAAGFEQRRFPLVYMFALYGEPDALTISQIGKRFSISRQAASKIVANLRNLGYVTVRPSSSDRREKVVELTPRAVDFVTARQRAASALDAEIRSKLGDSEIEHLYRMLAAVAKTSSSTSELEWAGRPPASSRH